MITINVEADIDDVMRGLDRFEQRAVRPAALNALRAATKRVEVLSVRYAAQKLRLRNKDIRRKKVVFYIKPSKRELSGSVYINEYGETMTQSRGYTYADATSASAKPWKNKAVHGQPFLFKGRNSSQMIWGMRLANKNRYENSWNSHEVANLIYRIKIQGAERVSAWYSRAGQRVFYRRFQQQLNYRLQRIRMS